MLNSNKDVGKQFGDWTIIQHLGHGKVICQCSCGTVKELYKKSLVEGKTKSCGCKKTENFRKTAIENIVGQTFGDWTVLSELGGGYVECVCSCGTHRKVYKPSLKNGRTKSCGCKQRKICNNSTN